MPPNLKRKRSSKVTKNTARADADQTAGEGGSSSAVATATATAGIDKYIDEFHDLEEKARSALIGYARTDIVKRDLNQQEKRLLLESFNQNGLDRFNTNHVVPLIVDKSILDGTSVAPWSSIQDAKRDGSHLPLLKLKGDDTLKNAGRDKETFGPRVLAAGGLHRRFALVDWLKQRETMAATALRTVNDLKKKLGKGDDEDSTSHDQVNAAEAQLAYLKGLLSMSGSWIVSIYDKALIESHGDIVGYHLSTNQRLYTYAESAEEGIIQTYLMMVSRGKKWTDCEVAQGLRTQSPGYKIATLLQQDYVWKLMETIVDMNETHYIHSDIFKMTRLTNDLLSEHGGLLAAVVIFLEHRLRLCFNDVEWDDAKIKRSQQMLAMPTSNESARTAADDYLVECIQTLEWATPSKGAINDELRRQIDAVYKTTLGDGDKWKYIGTDAPVWKQGYDNYVKGVVGVMRTMSEKMLKGENSSGMSDETKRVWKDCASKAKLVLEMKRYPQHPKHLPFMSMSVWQSLSQQFRRIPNTLVEISSWFSPLVYNHKIVGGRWKIGSATAEMMRALSAHPDIVSDLVPMCLRICTWNILYNFAALLRMEEELSLTDMPTRPESAKVVKEFMLLEGEHKVSKPWKPGQQMRMRVDRDEKDSDDDFLKKELNLEVVVIDEAIKAELKARWMDRVPSSWLEPWWRQIHISSKAGNDLYRTTQLLNHHTGYWGPTTAPSESRARKETISAAIAEYCTILDYRVPMLLKQGSPSAYIRTILELAMSFAVDKDKGRQGPTSRLLTWPDGIEFDTESAARLSFSIIDENLRSMRIASRKRDQDAIQKVISAVQSCPVAWAVTDDGEASTQTKTRPVRKEVAVLLEDLVKTLVKSAYQHREKTGDFGMTDGENPEEDSKKLEHGSEIPEEDLFKLEFLHAVQGQDLDDDDGNLDEGSIEVQQHATSISCLFSAFDNKKRLLSLGQFVERPSSQTINATRTSGANQTRGSTQKHIPFKVEATAKSTTVAPSQNLDVEMGQPS